MDLITIQNIINYLEDNREESIEVVLDNGLTYETQYLKLIDDTIYITCGTATGEDIAIIPLDRIHHVILKNSIIEKIMGFKPRPKA